MTTTQTADRTDIHYTDTGTGPVLVFTHSWGLNSGQWSHLIEHLVGEGFRCISYDRRGHGRSGAYDGEWTMDLLADDLADLLTHQRHLDEVTLVGHSMGCGEIVRYLSRHGTDHVKRVALVAPQLPMIVNTPDNPEGIDPAFIDALIAELERDARQWCVDAAEPFFGVGHTVAPEVVDWTVNQIAELPTHTLTATQRIGSHADYRDELTRLDLPVLLIQGDADVSTPIDLTGRRTAKLLPQVTFIEIPGGAHGIYQTHADRIAEELTAFCVQ